MAGTELVPWVIFILTLTSVLYTTQGACPVDWEPRGSDCYKVIYDVNFTSVYHARQTCLQEGADIASFPTPDTEAAIWGTVSAQKPDVSDRPENIYIGLADLSTTDGYSWLDTNSAPTYTNFSDVESNTGIQRHCVAAHSADRMWDVTNDNTTWRRVLCCFNSENIDSVVCKKPSDDNVTMTTANDTLHQYCYNDCPDGWRHYDNKCYYLRNNVTSQFESAYDARQTCLDIGSDLPSVTSLSTSQYISQMIQSESERPDRVYIGVSDVDKETVFVPLSEDTTGNYTEFDQDTLSSINSTHNDTDRNCVIMSSEDSMWDDDATRVWRDVTCCSPEGVSSVVCEKPVDRNVTMNDTDNDVIAHDCYRHINECDVGPCQNGGTCQDHVLYYTCYCAPGYYDVNCTTDFCHPSPCLYDGECELDGHGYRCNCQIEMTGENCETVTDLCYSDPCQNNATCEGISDDYNCTCLSGYEGSECEENIDDCANATCYNGGTCQDGVDVYTCQCPPKYTGQRCETETACGAPPVVGNSTSNYTSYDYEGQVIYQCFPGFKFPDMDSNKTIACRQDSSWDQPDLADCSPHCDILPYVANADSGDNPTTAVGSLVNYTCNTGYQMPDNSTFINITCLDTREWDTVIDNTTQCQIVECPELPVWPHQELATRNRTYNTTVVFWCDVGYVLHDNTTARTIKCLADGDWTAKLPPCEPIRCPHIDLPAGSTRNTSLNTYDTYATYNCDKGKRMTDGATWRIIKCDATTEWSDNVTDCDIDRCFPLPFVANATPSTLDALWDTETVLTCIAGHLFNPTGSRQKTRTMECQTNGRWSPILSACEPIYCDVRPNDMDSASNLASTNDYLYGTVVDFTCLRGHYYDASIFHDVITVECQESELWNVTVIPDCWPIQCENPPDIVNGTQGTYPNTNYSVVVPYTCDEGHLFIDGYTQRNITCQDRGNWDETDVSCRRDRCTPVPKALHATPDTTNTSWYINVTYACDIGHEWPPETYGNKTTHHITCENTPDTRWNDTDVPDCIVKYCPEIPDMDFATINGTENSYNSVVGYECDVGYKYWDNETVMYLWCSPDAQWEPADYPVCEIIHCPALLGVENATRDVNETEYDTLVTYTCEPGYQYPDKSKEKWVKCTENETWTDYPPPCEVVFCPPVPYWTETEFNTTDNEFNAIISYWCKDKYAFADSYEDPNATKTSECMKDKTWQPAIDTCKALESIAADLIGKTWESPQSVPIGTVACTLVCLMMACVILLDLNKLIHDVKLMKNNVSKFVNRNKVSDSCAQIIPDQTPPDP